MMLSLASQLAAAGRVALAGAALALLWDLYAALRGLLGLRRFGALLVSDLLFVSLLGPVAFVLLLAADGAPLRSGALVGLAAGVAGYRLTLSPYVVRLVWSAGASLGTLARTAAGTWWWLLRRSRPWGVP
ncbi:MAG TPA: spore cortex biosynthesis protein YabQ [Limnochordales bacterium]